MGNMDPVFRPSTPQSRRPRPLDQGPRSSARELSVNSATSGRRKTAPTRSRHDDHSAILRETRMSERIGRLCDELRIKLHGMDRRLEALKSNGAATFDQSQDVLESQLDRVEQRIYDNRVTVAAANIRVKTWLAEQKASSVADGPL